MYKVLFLDSTIKYRSKFAELYFNSICVEKGFNAIAYSAYFKDGNNTRPIMKNVIEHLDNLGINIHRVDHKFRTVNELLLEISDKIICMDMEVQLPMMRKQYPEYVRRATYWHFNPSFPPHVSLPRIQNEIDHFLASIMVTG